MKSLRWRVSSAGRTHRTGLRILFYHRVADADDELAVSPQRFREQMELLARDGWEVVDVATIGARLASGELDERTIGLSFDDAYSDIAHHAAPVLDALGFRATVFVSTGVTDGRAVFEWYERQPPVLTWEEICRLDGDVFLFEPHTVTHPNLTVLPEERARREIEDSKVELEAHLGRPTSVFSYPAGLFTRRERELVRGAGFSFAVSCEPGSNDGGADPLCLARIQVDRRDSLLDFRAKVGGGHDRPSLLRAAWRRVRYGTGASSRS